MGNENPSVYNSVVVSAPADAVWARLRNFHDMDWAPNVVESCEAVGEAVGTQIGARRIVNGVFHETLVGVDDQARLLRYSIDDGPDAVSKDNLQGYVGEVQVLPITENDTCVVFWSSSWTTSSSGGVAEFWNPIYQALLGDLKKTFS